MICNHLFSGQSVIEGLNLTLVNINMGADVSDCGLSTAEIVKM